MQGDNTFLNNLQDILQDDQQRTAYVNMAKIMRTYFLALIESEFTPNEAMALVISFQQAVMQRGQNGGGK